MLRYLSITNFALVENSEINFTDGLNIITGETGAGKSIIIQAASILLGGRASVDNIRSGMEEAVLTATIEIDDQIQLKSYLKEIGVVIENDEIIIRRVLTAAGKSRSFINGLQVTSKEMGVISSALFDFHGQHDGISLLKRPTHLGYLDNFLHLDNELKSLEQLFNDIKKIEESLRFLEESKKDKETRLELLNHEINEIEYAAIKDGEDDELKREIKIYENIEKITSSLKEVDAVFRGESGINSKLRLAKNLLSQVSELDQNFNKTANDVSDIFYQLEDITVDISTKLDHYEYEPDKLDNLIERSELIEKLKRKFGSTIQGVRDYLKKAKSELELITFSSQESEKLSSQLLDLKKKYLALAVAVSDKRKKGALNLEEQVKAKLSELGMNDVEFKIKIEPVLLEDERDYLEYDGNKIRYSYKGIDFVEFLISPNKGEPLKSLIKIASGGELSRIILSLKSVLFNDDMINTMIFDEIDAGIGGKVALAVGNSLKNLAKYKQIICITHLPQIAAAGTKNFVIQKRVKDQRTISVIEPVDQDQKVNEIARMLSGQLTEVSLSHAKELIISMEHKE